MATKWPLETFNSHNFLSISPLKNTIVCGVTMKMSKTCSLFSKNFWSIIPISKEYQKDPELKADTKNHSKSGRCHSEWKRKTGGEGWAEVGLITRQLPAAWSACPNSSKKCLPHSQHTETQTLKHRWTVTPRLRPKKCPRRHWATCLGRARQEQHNSVLLTVVPHPGNESMRNLLPRPQFTATELRSYVQCLTTNAKSALVLPLGRKDNGRGSSGSWVGQ